MKIFPVYYFPPVSWFAAILHESNAKNPIVLEQWEFYKKQQYFNRMTICVPSGTLKLSIPIRKASEYTPLKQRIISYDWTWQRDHWKSLESAYRSSPYFEYYEDRIQSLFESQPESLLELNLKTLDLLRDLLDLDFEYTLSTSFQDSEVYTTDYRRAFDAKRRTFPAWFQPQAYGQVFGPEFHPDMSILDLLFNRGPESVRILRECFRSDISEPAE